MPIKPSFQVSRKRRQYIASKQFTDREFPRDVFHRKLDELLNRYGTSEPKYHVITYYGVGGVGKTSLQRQLKIELMEKVPQAMYTSLDFADQALHSPGRALLELAREMKHQHKIKFPHFEIAYSIYFYKRNPDVVYNKKQLPFLDQMNVAGSVLSTLDGMGLIGSVTGFIALLYESSKKWGLDKTIKEELTELEVCSPQQIEERLPAFFAFDVQRAIEKFRIPVSVFFFDTYEAIWSSVKSDSTKFTRDAWVRELVALLPDVLFVICGREYIEWEAVDPDWRDILDQHLLDSLDEKNASTFLKLCGVEEEEIREKIISASGGHPYHLDLSVDTYFEMKNRGEHITVDQFGSNKREILDRFLRYLTEEEIQTLKIMSVPRFYNYEVFRYLLSRYPTGYPLTKFSDFNKFSFIHRDGNKYYIHALMREGMEAFFNDTVLKDVHSSMVEYYDNIFRGFSDSKSLFDLEHTAILETFYHKKFCTTTEEFIDWLTNDRLSVLRRLQLSGDTHTLRWLLQDLYDEVGSQRLGIPLFSILVDMVHLSGQYELAVSMIEELLGSLRLRKEPWEQGELHLAIRKIHHQMFYLPVQGLIDELVRYEPIARENNWVTEYNEILFTLGGNLGVLSGDLFLSRKWLIKSIRTARETNCLEHLCRALRKYADVLRLRGHLEWAKIACKQGLEIAREKGYERYECYLLVTLADIYRAQRRYDTANALFEEAEKIVQRHGITAWGAHLHVARAEMLFQEHNFHEAAKHWAIAHKIYTNVNQKWGKLQSELGLERCRQRGIIIDTGQTIEEVRKEAQRLGYTREAAIAEKIAKGESVLIQIPFL